MKKLGGTGKQDTQPKPGKVAAKPKRTIRPGQHEMVKPIPLSDGAHVQVICGA